MRTDIRTKLNEMRESENPTADQIMTLYRMFETETDEEANEKCSEVYDAMGRIFPLDYIESLDGMMLPNEMLSFITISPYVTESRYTSDNYISDGTDEYEFVTVELSMSDGETVSLSYCLYLGPASGEGEEEGGDES